MFKLEKLTESLLSSEVFLINTKGLFLEESLDLIKKYTGFSGSNAVALISKDVKYLITDGRYIAQANSQCVGFKILNQTDVNVYEIINSFDKAFLPAQTLSADFIERIKIPCDFFSVDLKNDFADFEYKDFLENRINIFQKKIYPQNAFLLSPEKTAHFFGIRSKNFCQTRIPNVYGIITEKSKFVSSDVEKIKQILKLENIKTLTLNKKSINLMMFDSLKNDFDIKHDDFLNENKLQAIKTNEEIEKIKHAHVLDAVAINKFTKWLYENIDKDIYESDCVDAMENFKLQNSNYIGSSFNTIAGFKENGAVIHYNHTQNNKKLDKTGVLLIDSGSQYEGLGTTDMTRVFSFGSISDEIKIAYTVTLKSHIAVASFKWQTGMIFSQLDTIARYKFWEVGLQDYAHGTGHGVGFCADVHEGPFGLSKYCNLEIQPNIVFSNEPGYYKIGSFGIRLENLYYSTSSSFENLTLIPFNENLIKKDLLNQHEISWLDSYNTNCLKFLI